MYEGLLISLVLIIVSVLGFSFGVIPAMSSTVEEFKKLNDLNKLVGELDDKVRTLESLNETELRQQLSIITSSVPSEKNLPSIIATIEKLAAQTGADIVSFTLSSAGSIATAAAVKQTSDEKLIGSFLIPFSVLIQGTLEETRDFLAKATGVRRLLRVRNFDITTVTGTITTRLSMDAFYLPLPTTIPVARESLNILSKEEQQTLAKLASYPWLFQPSGSAVGPTTSGKTNPFVK